MENTTERRMLLLRILSSHEKYLVEELSAKLGVSKKTIYRDVKILSTTIPIFTEPGVHGGIYVSNDWQMNMIYLNSEQEQYLQFLISNSDDYGRKVLESILFTYSNPQK